MCYFLSAIMSRINSIFPGVHPMKKFDVTAILPNKFQRLWKVIEADTKEEAVLAFSVLFREFLEDVDEYILIARPYKAIEIHFLPESQSSDAPEANPKFFIKEK